MTSLRAAQKRGQFRVMLAVFVLAFACLSVSRLWRPATNHPGRG
nr:MAG TPA: hypothetical protein [Caudoviricetes sp.]